MATFGFSDVQVLAATGLDAFATITIFPTVAWAVISGMVATWFGHRYVEATDDDGYEFALLSTADCGHCGHEITLSQLAPGRLGICGGCGRALPASWIGGVLASLVGCLAMLATFGNNAIVIPYLWLVPVLVAAALVDLRTMLIPKRIVWVGFGVGLSLMAVTAAWIGLLSSLQGALIGAVAYFGLMFVLHMVSPGGLGFGDVRLALILGLYLGWIDVRLTLFGLFIGNVAYLVYALPQRIRHGREGGRFSPFGPGLAVGTVVALCCYSILV